MTGHGKASVKTLKYWGEASMMLPDPPKLDHGSTSVRPDDLFQFLFPPGFFHSKSTARLYIFAEFGPVLVESKGGFMSMRSGYKGQHVLTDQELNDMIEEMIKEDILKVYVGDAVLKPSEQTEVIAQADDKLKSIPNYTKEHIEDLLEHTRDGEGNYNFHKMQKVIRKERYTKLAERKRMYPDVAGNVRLPPNAFGFYTEGVQQTIRPKKYRDNDIFIITSKALSKNSFKIAETQDKNNPSIVINSRLLRDDQGMNPALPAFKIPLMKSKGSYVRPHEPWTSKVMETQKLRIARTRRER
mmetsp:Transcript_44263/g.110851  ORF Transcript_44263/g.110851 Transcript_44263/m.110851 type:complete len:299 (+) Transcript_44263:45-941(+)